MVAITERRKVPFEEAIARLPKGDDIHTFLNAPFGLIGADHRRESIIADIRKYGVEEAGAGASAMGHTLVIVDYNAGGKITPLFIEASRPAEAQDATK